MLVPDFWLGEATNVLWLQVRRKLPTLDEAREGVALLRAQVEPTPTADMSLHEITLEIGLAFAIAMDARGVVVSDGPFVRDIQTHPDPALAGGKP